MLVKKEDNFFSWTKHSQYKLKEYNLSGKRIKRIIRHPDRIEEGIAPGTIAAMQKSGSKKHPYEIWTMYVLEKSKIQNQRLSQKLARELKLQPKIRVISAWKYPGITKPGDPLPIPPEVFEEIMKLLNIS